MTIQLKTAEVVYFDMSKAEPMTDRLKVTLTNGEIVYLAPVNSVVPSTTLCVMVGECTDGFEDEMIAFLRRIVKIEPEDARSAMRATTSVWNPDAPSENTGTHLQAGEKLELILDVPGWPGAIRLRSMPFHAGEIEEIEPVVIGRQKLAVWNVA